MKYVPGTFVVVPEVHRLAGKNPIMQSLFMWICHFLGDNGNCWPSQKTLAKLSGTSVNSVKKYLEELETIGIIKRERRYENGCEITSAYYIDIGKGPPPVDTPPPPNGGGVPHQMATELNTLELNKKKDKKESKKIAYHPHTASIISLFSSEVRNRGMVYEELAEYKSAHSILNDESIKSFVLEHKFAKMSEFILWIMDNADDWHRPRMTSLRYFHSNWAKIANLNMGKLKAPKKEETDARIEKAKKLLSL